MRETNIALLIFIIFMMFASLTMQNDNYKHHTATIQAIDSLSNTMTQKNKETAKSDTLKIRLKKELLVLLNDINEVQ